jgi:APA family basic amino acid/polyamine antiporter
MTCSGTQYLKREIGLFSALGLVVANMVGTGIFTTTGFIIQELMDPLTMMLCWLVGGLFALSGALCYAELGARFPRAGGEYVFLKESFGDLPAFMSGWISLLVGFSAPIAAAAIAFSEYTFQLFPPAFSAPGVVSLPFMDISIKTVVACGVIVLISLAHHRSVRLGKGLQNLLTLFKLGVILCFAGAGFAWGQGSWEHFSGPLLSMEMRPLDVLDSRFAVALVFVTFSYTGWNAAAYLGGEIQSPKRNIPLALILGTLVVICLYLLLNILYVFALAPDNMAGAPDVGAKAACALFGPFAGRIFSGAIGLGLASALSAMIVTGPRVYYAMAKDGLFFSMFSRVSRKHGTPGSAIFLQAGLAVAMVMTASFEHLLIYIGFTLSLVSSLTVLGMMRLRYCSKEIVGKTGFSMAYRTPGYPFTPLLFVAGNIWIILFSITDRPVSAAWGLGTIALGLPFYFWFKKRRATLSRPGKGSALSPLHSL